MYDRGSMPVSRVLMLAITTALGFTHPGFSEPAWFDSGKPVWPEGRETEKNLFVGFRATFDVPKGETVVLRLTGSTLYRIFLNGAFVGHGPARGPHGFYRVDEWTLTNSLRAKQNVLAIEVAGYNANSYYILDQPSFLQAEVVSKGRVLASTAGGGIPFEATILAQRVQKVQRYSFQRPFIEFYRLDPDSDRWRTDAAMDIPAVVCAEVSAKQILPRRVPYPRFTVRQPHGHIARGELETEREVEKLWKDRSLVNIGPKLGGYPQDELELAVSNELQHIANVSLKPVDQPLTGDHSLELREKQYHILDFGTNLTGFLGARILCKKALRLYLVFDEILTDGDVDFKRLGCVNAIGYDLQPGTYKLESFEPYTLRYAKVLVLEGEGEIESIYLREYVNPDVWEAHFACSDERLNRLFEAGRETFRQNAVDIFMDCPSRERAGWLCDSFFAARVAKKLSGDTRVETNFFENFLLPERFEHLPEGMLPMCYPADHNDEVFIPNWALWFVVQLEEYVARGGDKTLAVRLEAKVLKLFDYFEPFHNEGGLLEKLESWVFVEWSAANRFVQDVNYPSNMLYAAALAAAGRMYDRPELAAKASGIRETVLAQSFDGEFFVDNAVRKDGKLEVTNNRTEVCQYFAFFFNIVDPGSHPELWRKLTDDFGPQRKETGKFPEIHEANSFVGNVLRLEILSRYGRCQQILDESIAYLLYMAERTGTLWENVGAYASCNHGFASHAVHVLYRDVLGLLDVDTVGKQVRLRFSELEPTWCEGSVPTPDGQIALRWRKTGDGVTYRVDVPFGYTWTVENETGVKLTREP